MPTSDDILRRAYKLKALAENPGATQGEAGATKAKLDALLWVHPEVKDKLAQAAEVEVRLSYKNKREHDIAVELIYAYLLTPYGRGKTRYVFTNCSPDLARLLKLEYGELRRSWANTERGAFHAFITQSIDLKPYDRSGAKEPPKRDPHDEHETAQARAAMQRALMGRNKKGMGQQRLNA